MGRSSAEKEPRWPASALTLSLLAFVTFLVTFPVGNYDIFWHLSNGRAMVELGRIVNEEVLSFSAPGRPFPNHWWLAQLTLYGTFQIAGVNGLLALKLICVGAMALLLYRTLCLQAPAGLAWLLVAAGVLAAQARFTARPQVVSFALLALLGWLLYRFRAGRVRPGWLWSIPPLLAVWSCLHGGAIFGDLLLAGFTVGETLRRSLRRWPWAPRGPDPLPAGALRHLWRVGGVTLAVDLINPYGLRSYLGLIDFAQRRGLMAANATEFLPTDLAHHRLFWGLLILTWLLALIFARRADLTQLLLLIPFTWLGMRFTRATAIFCIVALPSLAYSGRLLLERLAQRRRAVRAAGALATLALLGWSANSKLLAGPLPFRFGAGLNELSYPIGGARFVRALNLQGNLFNMPWNGGYLAWALGPERKIFLYSLPAVFDGVADDVHDPDLLDRHQIEYGITAALFEHQLLFGDHDRWVPIHRDRSAFVSIRNAPRNRAIIEQYGLRFLTPELTNEGVRALEKDPRVRPHLLREVARTLAFARDPEKAQYLATWLAKPDSGLGPAETESLAALGLRYNLESAALWEARAAALVSLGRFDEAGGCAQRALAIEPSRPVSWTALGRAALERGDWAQARRAITRAATLEPDNPQHLFGLALLDTRQGRRAQAQEGWRRYLERVPTGPFAEEARLQLGVLSE